MEVPGKQDVSDICFIVCPDYWAFTPSLGVATLSGVLKQAGYRVKVADINVAFLRENNRYEDTVSKMMREMSKPLEDIRCRRLMLRHLIDGRSLESLPDDVKGHKIWQDVSLRHDFFEHSLLDDVGAGAEVLGFTLIEDNLLCSLAAINSIKSRYPDKTIIVGGPECHHLNALEVLKLSAHIDMICSSDGEVALLNYLNSRNGTAGQRSGYMVREDGHWQDYGTRELTNSEFNVYGAMPDFSEFPLHLYLEPGSLSLATSRGCTGKCLFCSEKLLYAPYRRLNADSLASMLTRIREQYAPSRIRFSDSLLNGSSRVFTEFLKALKKLHWQIPWEGNVRADNIDGRCFKLLRKTRCSKILCGIESMIPDVLRGMKKDVSLSHIKKTIETAHNHGIMVHGYLIVGFPGEKTGDFMDTMPLLFELDSFHVHVITWKCLPDQDVEAIFSKFRLQPSLDYEEQLDRQNDPPPLSDYILKKHLRGRFFTDENGYDLYDRSLRQVYSMQLLKTARRMKPNRPDMSVEFVRRYDWLPFPVVQAEPADNRFFYYGRQITTKTRLGHDIFVGMDGSKTVKQIAKELANGRTTENEVYTAIRDILNTIWASTG